MILISSYLSCSLFSEILMWFCGLVPRHGTNTLDCRAQWHGTARSGVLSAVPGPEAEHGGTTRHGTARLPCLTVPCLAVPCPAVLVPCSARAARLEIFTDGRPDPNPTWPISSLYSETQTILLHLQHNRHPLPRRNALRSPCFCFRRCRRRYK